MKKVLNSIADFESILIIGSRETFHPKGDKLSFSDEETLTLL